jgi:hypothetical protein
MIHAVCDHSPVNWFPWRRGGRYLRAVHYFGYAQPINFWDSADLSLAPGHLERIREDGFDTVIVAVPWRGFQRTVVPSTFDERCLSRLRRLLGMVRAAGLQSIVRVSFPWSGDPHSVGDFDERALALFTRRDARQGWLEYLREIRKIAEAFDGFQFAFFSWEEFPSLRELMQHRTPEARLELAGALGYRDYLAERFSLIDLRRLFGRSFESFDEVYVPLADCEAFRTYHGFVNAELGKLLADGRAVWPRLALQVRVDLDAMYVKGQHAWLENDIRTDDPGMRVTYYLPAMYTLPGETVLPAPRLLANLEKMLTRVTDGGRNTRHFLDQFIFHDESPQFQAWTKVAPGDIPAFLAGAGRLLRRYSRGFGFWHYFDYRANHLYNAGFIFGLEGWTHDGGVSLGPEGELRFVRLEPGASITQRTDPHRVGWGSPYYETMRFRAMARLPAGAARLRLRAGGIVDAEIDVAGDGFVEAAFPPDRHRNEIVDVTIENAGTVPVEITDLNLWGFVFRSRIYDEHGNPGEHLEAARAMLRA